MRLLILAALVAAPLPVAAKPAQAAEPAALQSAIAAKTRSPANIARDKYRNPAATLSFFGIAPDMNVVEVWPGAGWYTEILAPYLAAKGRLSVMVPAGKYGERIRQKLGADPATYGKVVIAGPNDPLVADGSADLVLTFRNVHNWVMAGDDMAAGMFADFFRMLKPGGTLGVVDHRLEEGADAQREKASGYVKRSTVLRLAEQAGFKLAAESEINANPRDTRDHPNGVWSLPPSLREGDKDRARYLTIGESDRMTLKFVKPAS
jgi:predicted methyltransferase